MKKDLTCKLKREIGNTVARSEYSTLDIDKSFKYSENSEGSLEIGYSYNIGAAYKIKQPNDLWNKIKNFTKVSAFVLGVGILSAFGCATPYEPVPTEKPTPTEYVEPTAEPSPTNTAQPTPIVTNVPTDIPTEQPTIEPTPEPTEAPTAEPDYVDISGQVENYENQRGIVRVYNNENNNFLGEYATDSSGHFAITLDKLVNELPEGVRLETKLSDSDWENATSYTRKITLPQGDQSNVEVYPVAYPDFCTPEEFRQHMEDINSTYSKWNLDSLKKIKIFKYNGSEGEFTDTQTAHIVSRITDSEDIEKFVKGKELDDYVEVINDSPSKYWEDNCIYVVPDTTPGGSGTASGAAYTKKTINKIIYRNRIELHPEAVIPTNVVISHEFGHAFIAPDGHSNLSDDLTIMNEYNNTGDMKPLVADEKAGNIVYENTYQSGEDLDNILGL